MKKYSENEINEKLINHTKLKLTASLFMFLDNMRKIKTDENPFIPYELPKEYDEIKQFMLKITKDLKGILSVPVQERIASTQQLQNAKENLISISESFYSYLSMTAILAEIIVDYRRIKMMEDIKKSPIDFHAFFHDVMDFVEKDEVFELRCTNISYMMKCFPLFMTKEKYADYVSKGIMMLFDNESKSYISNAAKALKFRFLPISTEGYGKILHELKDYFNSLMNLEYEKMSIDELDEIFQGLEDTGENLEEMADYLSLLYETINFAILTISFSGNFDYLIDGNAVYKDAFYLVCEKMDKEISEDDLLLSETADEIFDSILIDLIDKILADEKDGFLNESKVGADKFSQQTQDLFRVNGLISTIYYEMLQDKVYNVEPARSEQSEKSDKEFVEKTMGEILDYINLSCKGLNSKMQKQVKRLFLSCFPSPFSAEEFMSYAEFVINNLTSYEKKARILDSVGMVFESTGFLDDFTEENHHHHGEDCDCGHHH